MPLDTTTQTRPEALPVTLIDTRDHSWGVLLNYGKAVDPKEDGEGLIVTREASGWFQMVGPDGSIELCPAEARALVKELARALKIEVGQ